MEEPAAFVTDTGRASPLRQPLAEVPMTHRRVEYNKAVIMELYEALRTSDKPGIGLAANQIGQDRRIILLLGGGVDAPIVNPEIARASSSMFNSEEECLSCPDLKVTVRRHKIVTVKGFTYDWRPIRLKLRGLMAACAQHEIDHLDGITLRSRLETGQVVAKRKFRYGR